MPFCFRLDDNSFETAMSYTDGDDVARELDEIMRKRESSKKRRRSGTKDTEDNSLPQLVIKDLSISPSNRGRPHTVGIATDNQLTNDFGRDDEIEVCELCI